MDKRFHSGVLKRLEDAKVTATTLWREAKSMKGERMGMSKDDYVGYYQGIINKLREFIDDARLLHEQMAFFEYGGIEKLSKKRLEAMTAKPMRKIKVIKKGTRNPMMKKFLVMALDREGQYTDYVIEASSEADARNRAIRMGIDARRVAVYGDLEYPRSSRRTGGRAKAPSVRKSKNPLPSEMTTPDRLGFTPLLNLSKLTSFSLQEGRRSYAGKKNRNGDFETVIEQSGMRTKKTLDADYVLKLIKANLNNPTLVVKHGKTAYRNPAPNFNTINYFRLDTGKSEFIGNRKAGGWEVEQKGGGYGMMYEWDDRKVRDFLDKYADYNISFTKNGLGKRKRNPMSEMQIQIPLVIEYVEGSSKREFRIAKASESPEKIIRKMINAFYELSYDEDAIAQRIPRVIREAEDILIRNLVVSSDYLPEFIEEELAPFFNGQLTGALTLDVVGGWWVITIDPYEERDVRNPAKRRKLGQFRIY